ncbi:facilitated trehalose transporter Tret1-2 homolog [Thrips palmi]|uniref:Facilitated trehalose transporter Tret1-2 homolog n=1 Tax=Thrips palmi TaxID=161013 RepID=A0A6P8Z3I3_THRPL|nr:facilitated trehalose transporter Tret1-2 homolog [Thrips palmi]XP_034244272.1 facilitated trehalose transporter Tret1-2 homolog [Thrips palmi]
MAVKDPPSVATVDGNGAAHPAEYGAKDRQDDAQARGHARRAIWKQFAASAAVQCFHLMTGVCMAYSSSLIPALEAADSDIPVTRHQSAWLASTFVLAVPVGSTLSLCLNDVLGRLMLVKTVSIPYCIGWSLIATATSFEQLVIGRLCTGVAIGMAHSPSLLFITEVATKNIRGGLTAVATALASMGIVGCYVMGAYMDWRTHAWALCAVPALPLLLQTVFATESPVWLRARGRTEAGAKASQYYYNDPDMVLSGPSASAKGGNSIWHVSRLLFTNPLGYKPLILVFAMFVIQQVVGVYITIYYAVTFFQETGSTIDAYMATILIGVVRFIGCTTVSLVMTKFGRRTLMLLSSVGQTVFMTMSGYATMCILQEPGSVSSMWVVAGLLGYIALGCLGWQTIPWSMMAELFPHEVRSLAQPFNSSMAHILMFAMLQVYPILNDLVGGAAGIQYLFAAVSALSAVFVFVFLPETRGRTLPEIEDYFRNNVTFLTEKARRRAARRAVAQAALTAKTPSTPPV